MHSKQLKYFKPLNPDRRRETGRESRIERDVMGKGGGGGGGRAKGESLSQWEMTNAICPEHSACVNPWRVPAGPHPTLRPLHPPHPPNHSLCFHWVGESVTEEIGPSHDNAKCAFP